MLVKWIDVLGPSRESLGPGTALVKFRCRVNCLYGKNRLHFSIVGNFQGFVTVMTD